VIRRELMLTPEAEARLERRFAAQREAEVLLDLINAEFQSDPQACACFDLRIVARVKECVRQLRENPGF
jgi:hypothetical protein